MSPSSSVTYKRFVDGSKATPPICFAPIELREIEIPRGIGLDLPGLHLAVLDREEVVGVIGPDLIRVVAIERVIAFVRPIGIVKGRGQSVPKRVRPDRTEEQDRAAAGHKNDASQLSISIKHRVRTHPVPRVDRRLGSRHRALAVVALEVLKVVGLKPNSGWTRTRSG